MSPKAKLTLLLKADETIVAEIEDAVLWHRVLGIINQGDSKDSSKSAGLDPLNSAPLENNASPGAQDAISKFSKRLGLSSDVVVGALAPSTEPPYLELNSHNWEAFKKVCPARGPGAVSAIGLAGTALALWLKDARLEVPATQALATAVLDTISIKDPNASRGIKNSKWLQGRSGGTIIVNPAEISKAQEIVRAYCLKKAPSVEP
jgi:hypothetical protein